MMSHRLLLDPPGHRTEANNMDSGVTVPGKSVFSGLRRPAPAAISTAAREAGARSSPRAPSDPWA